MSLRKPLAIAGVLITSAFLSGQAFALKTVDPLVTANGAGYGATQQAANVSATRKATDSLWPNAVQACRSLGYEFWGQFGRIQTEILTQSKKGDHVYEATALASADVTCILPY